MLQITEVIIESNPVPVFTNQNLKVKIKVEGDYVFEKGLITENGLDIITENGQYLMSEWGIEK